MTLEVLGIHGDDDFDVVSKFLQHDDLVIRGEAGQHARCVHIVDEFAAELQVELSTEVSAPLGDVLRLESQVGVAVKSDTVHGLPY